MNLKEVYEAANAQEGEGHALVVLSGGQDSTTCLHWANHVWRGAISAVTFDYGQKHSVEIESAKKNAERLGIQHYIIPLPQISLLAQSALLKHPAMGGPSDVSVAHPLNKDLPASFVPNRNAALLTSAHALAQQINASHLVTGVCQTDYSGYPDCREEFINALELALNLGAAKSVMIHTPLMHLSKADTFELAQKLGVLLDIVNDTHTCYNGDHTTYHPWGYGCGECPACKIRSEGYYSFVMRS